MTQTLMPYSKLRLSQKSMNYQIIESDVIQEVCPL
jgi:hypothetical protein